LKYKCSGSGILDGNTLNIIGIALVIVVIIIFKDKIGSIFSKSSSEAKANAKFSKLNQDVEKDEDFNKLFFDNEESVVQGNDDKQLVDIPNKKEKKMTSGKALDNAKMNVPTIAKPADEINLMDFNANE